MLNKLIIIVLSLCLVFIPSVALSSEAEPLLPPKGKITGLRYKQKAPYSGVLLNSIAAAKLLTDHKYLDKQWELRLQYELARQASKFKLTIESQKVTYLALQEKHTTLLGIKDKEIERLTKIAANTNDYSVWWATGGVIVGIALTIAVVYAVHEVK
jgi:hypothetical protein